MRPHRTDRKVSLRRANPRYLLKVAGVCGVLVGAVVLLHEVQSPRNARFLLSQADGAYAAGRYDEAIDTLSLYRRIRPQDRDATRRLGLWLAEHGDGADRRQARSLLLNEARLDGDRIDPLVRTTLLRLALRSGVPDDAVEQARHLAATAPTDAASWRLVAEGQAGGRRWQEALAAYESALAIDPRSLPTQQGYLDLLARHGDVRQTRTSEEDPTPTPPVAEMVERALAQMKAANADRPTAAVVEYVIRRDHRLPGADRVLDEALRNHPESVEVKLMAIGRGLAEGDVDAVARLLAEAQRLAPRDPRILSLLGKWQYSRGDVAGALASLRAADEGAGGLDPATAWRLAEILYEQGLFADAEPYLQRLRRDRGYSAALLYLNGRRQLRQGRPEQARESLREASLAAAALPELAPDHARELRYKIEINGAGLAYADGHTEEALRQADSAHRMYPGEPLPSLIAGGILAATGAWEDAADRFGRVVALPSAPPQAWLELARVQLPLAQLAPVARRDFSKVRQSLDAARRRIGESPEMTLLAADLAVAEGKADEALDVLRAGVQRYPRNRSVALSLARLLVAADRPEAAARLLDALEQAAGATPSVRLAQAQLRVRQGDLDGAAERLRPSDAAAGKEVPPVVRAELAAARADVAWLQGDVAAARAHLEAAADAGELAAVHRLLFRLARHETAAAERLVAQWRAEGSYDDGLWQWADARTVVQRFAAEPMLAAPTLRRRLTSLRRSRPHWWGTAEVAGLLAEVSGRDDEAAGSYRRALLTGPAGPPIVARLVDLLAARQAWDDVADVLRRVERRFPHPLDPLLRANAEIAQGDAATARRRVDALSEEHPDDPAIQGLHALLRARLDDGPPDEVLAVWRNALESSRAESPDADWLPVAYAAAARGRADGGAFSAFVAAQPERTDYLRGLFALVRGDREAAVVAFGSAAEGPLEAGPWRVVLTTLSRSDGEDRAEPVAELAARAAGQIGRPFWLEELAAGD